MKNDKCKNTAVEEPDPPQERTYDLEERTAKFGEAIIDFLRPLPRDEITRPLISQLVRSATSIAANYCGADDGVSRADFCHRIGTSRKEAKESKLWLRMIARAVPAKGDHARVFCREANELHLILSKIYWNTRRGEERDKKKRRAK